MCGRFSVGRTATSDDVCDQLAFLFDAARAPELPRCLARFNIAPGQLVPSVLPRGGGRVLSLLRWGFVFPWAKNPDEGPRPINARIETVQEKAAFRSALVGGRCLVPADGFYEWQRSSIGRLPWFFSLVGGEMFAFAGILSRSSGFSSDAAATFAILTTEANPTVAPIHDRMPVMLTTPESCARWLAGTPPAEFEAPLSAAALTRWRVDPRVNDARNEDPSLATPVEESLEEPNNPQRRLL